MQVYERQEKTQLPLDENSDSIHVFWKPQTSYAEESLQLPYKICTMYVPQCGTQDVPNSRLGTHYNLPLGISHDPGSCTLRNLHGMDCTDIWGDTWNVYTGKSGIYHSVNWLVHKGFPPHISLSQVSQMPHNKTRQDWSSRKHFRLKTRGILFFFPMVFPWSLCPSSSHQISQVEISAEI